MMRRQGCWLLSSSFKSLNNFSLSFQTSSAKFSARIAPALNSSCFCSAATSSDGGSELCADSLVKGRFIRTLEISTKSSGVWSLLPGGEAAGLQLLNAKKIHATVHPDLPPLDVVDSKDVVRPNGISPPPPSSSSATARRRTTTTASSSSSSSSSSSLSFQNSSKRGSSSTRPWSWKFPGAVERRKNEAGVPEEESKPIDKILPAGSFQIHTVAAQTKSMDDICLLMQQRAGIISSVCTEGALLLVSGSDPARRSSSEEQSGELVSSMDMLKVAHSMRRDGLLPSWVQFWALENPLANPVDRFARKLEAGAEAIIVQPPLLPDSFHGWWQEASRQGLIGETRVLVGVPFISSSKNLSFWMNLTNAQGKEAEQVLRLFGAGEDACSSCPPSLFDDFLEAWTMSYVTTVQSLPGAGGMHLMPVTARGWRDFAVAVEKQLL